MQEESAHLLGEACEGREAGARREELSCWQPVSLLPQRPQTSVSQGESSGTRVWRWGPRVPMSCSGLDVCPPA